MPPVTPAKAGVHVSAREAYMDTRLRGHDEA